MLLILPLPPSVNRYWRVVHGHPVLSADAKAYKAAVGLHCNALRLTPTTQPVALRIHVYRARRAGDLDNSLKAILDALKGHAYLDDDQVTEIHAWRADDRRNPRVEVEIAPVTVETP